MGKTHRAVSITVPIARFKSKSFLAGVTSRVIAARKAGHPVCIVFDYHIDDPYHGVPPHLDVTGPGANGSKVTKNKARREAGLGYAPFGWVDGWVWARAALTEMIKTWNPEYIRQGYDSHIRNGWYFVAEKDYWHYNDIGGIFEQAINDVGWRGIYIVEAFRNSMYKARKRYGNDRVIWVDAFEAIPFDGDDVIDDDDPPTDDCAGCLDELEECDDEVEALRAEVNNLQDYVEQLQADIAMLESRNASCTAEVNSCYAALTECQQTECDECEDCDAKYQGLQDSLDDLLDIIWSFLGRSIG